MENPRHQDADDVVQPHRQVKENKKRYLHLALPYLHLAPPYLHLALPAVQSGGRHV